MTEPIGAEGTKNNQPATATANRSRCRVITWSHTPRTGNPIVTSRRISLRHINCIAIYYCYYYGRATILFWFTFSFLKSLHPTDTRRNHVQSSRPTLHPVDAPRYSNFRPFSYRDHRRHRRHRRQRSATTAEIQTRITPCYHLCCCCYCHQHCYLTANIVSLLSPGVPLRRPLDALDPNTINASFVLPRPPLPSSLPSTVPITPLPSSNSSDDKSHTSPLRRRRREQNAPPLAQ